MIATKISSARSSRVTLTEQYPSRIACAVVAHAADQRLHRAAHVQHRGDAGLRDHAVPYVPRAGGGTADVAVGVDDPRKYCAPAGIDYAAGLGVVDVLGDGDHAPALDAEIARPFDAVRRVDERARA